MSTRSNCAAAIVMQKVDRLELAASQDHRHNCLEKAAPFNRQACPGELKAQLTLASKAMAGCSSKLFCSCKRYYGVFL